MRLNNKAMPDITLIKDSIRAVLSNLTLEESIMTSTKQTLLQEEATLKELHTKQSLFQQSKDIYSQAIELLYSKSIGEVEATINLGLQYIFYDKNYNVKFEFVDRVNKTLMLYLKDLNTNNEINLKTGVGAGIRSVVSFVLLVFYLLAKNSYPVLFLDEAYSEISQEYVERFFEFLTSLCNQKDLSVILITHDKRFLAYSDKVYRVADGTIISEVSNVKESVDGQLN